MYNETQVIEGIMRYVKGELIPVLPSYAKVLAGATLLHNTNRIGELLTTLSSGSLMKAVGVVSADGTIDVDVWCQDLKRSIDEFCGGRMELQLPMLSPIIFTSSDVDTLRRYIRGEL